MEKEPIVQIVRLKNILCISIFIYRKILKTKEKLDITYIRQDFTLSSLTTRKITSYQL